MEGKKKDRESGEGTWGEIKFQPIGGIRKKGKIGPYTNEGINQSRMWGPGSMRWFIERPNTRQHNPPYISFYAIGSPPGGLSRKRRT